MAAIRLDGPRGELIVLLRPRELESLAGHRAERRARERERDLRARSQRVGDDVLLRVVGGAAARPEPVDRERDRGGEVAGVAGAAARHRRSPGGRARSAARSSSGTVASAASMPGHRRTMSGVEASRRRARAGSRRARRSKASAASARRSQTSSPSPGTTLNASPACRTVGTAVRRSGPSGSWQAATAWAAAGEREQRVAPVVGRRAGVRRAAARRAPAASPAALRRTTTPSSPSGVALAALEAQAGVEAGEALDVARTAPSRHSSSQTSSSATSAKSSERAAERAHHAEREHDAALHVDRARADQLVVVALERAVVGVRDDGVDVAEQQHPARARRRHPRDQVLRVTGRGARHALDRRRRRAAARRRRRRTPRRRARRRRARRRRRAPPARARRACRSDASISRPSRPRPSTVPGYRLWAMPELPEMEIVARRLGEALTGETIESAVAPGINALKTFDPPLQRPRRRDDRGLPPPRQAADARRRRPARC